MMDGLREGTVVEWLAVSRSEGNWFNSCTSLRSLHVFERESRCFSPCLNMHNPACACVCARTEKQHSNKVEIRVVFEYLKYGAYVQYAIYDMWSSQGQGCFIDAAGVLQTGSAAVQNKQRVKMQNIQKDLT